MFSVPGALAHRVSMSIMNNCETNSEAERDLVMQLGTPVGLRGAPDVEKQK